ncbi:hypothetical protein [Rufibacter roseus]|uniref:Uncharacterized protein n=1 Tax=Rufibacter roseus TaxID=1567108 RepID=A0ABW2DLQ7_9BACT|nr:hypothetical protein [Rufibacter roseus]
MNNPTIPLNVQEASLIRELLEKSIPYLDATIKDAENLTQVAKKAQFSKSTIEAYLNKNPDKNGCLAFPEEYFLALLYKIRVALCKRADVMLALLHDTSLSTDVQIQLAQDSAVLLNLIRIFQDPSLPRLISSSESSSK